MACRSCQPLQERNQLLEQRMKELQRRLDELEQRNTALQDQINTLRSYVWKPKRQEPEEPKQLGPPKNHEPHHRPPPAEIHETKNLSLAKCPHCDTRLGKPVRIRDRYVEDIRPPEPWNTRYTIPVYYCRACKKQVSPKPAGAIPHCQLGIRILLLATYLRYRMILPFNKIAELLETLAGFRVSEGYLVDALTRFARYAGPEFGRIREAIRQEPAVNIDETGWPVHGRRQWLWDFVSERYTLLLVRDSRAQAVVYEALGTAYQGVSTGDDAKMYERLGWTQQTCWAHLLRRTKEFARTGSREGTLLHEWVKEVHRLATSRRVGKGHLHAMVDGIVAYRFQEPRCRAFVKRLVVNREKLFTFLYRPGVSDTNNAAERGLRPSVVMRKITGGNRSLKGAVNHEVIMSVLGTWEKEGKDFLGYGEEYLRRAVGE